MNKTNAILIITVLLLSSANISIINGQDHPNKAYEICLSTFKNASTIKTLNYVMYKQERIKGEMKTQVSATKLRRNPYQIYVKQQAPKKGIEVLFDEEQNSGKALINPNGFPWMNISLEPLGTIMRKNQHHTIKDAGFDLVISILEFLFNKYGDDAQQKVSLGGHVIYDDIKCYKVIFENKDFKYKSYVIKENETLITLAEKYKLSEHMILEANKNVSSYEDVSEGDEIFIPNDYCPKMELLIDQKRMIPLSIKVFDDKGLYEYFRYSKVVLNPDLNDDVFDKENCDYNF